MNENSLRTLPSVSVKDCNPPPLPLWELSSSNFTKGTSTGWLKWKVTPRLFSSKIPSNRLFQRPLKSDAPDTLKLLVAWGTAAFWILNPVIFLLQPLVLSTKPWSPVIFSSDNHSPSSGLRTLCTEPSSSPRLLLTTSSCMAASQSEKGKNHWKSN